MRAMVLFKQREPLQSTELPDPRPERGQILIRVHACAACRTDIHIIDGALEHPRLPLILGHQIAGEVAALGEGARRFKVGDRVGVPWLGWTDGTCEYCTSGRENLCEKARYTGYDIDGGFAELTVADERFVFPIPEGFTSVEAAPLLCGGLIGYRAYRLAGDAKRIGFYGFGSAAHILAQVARYQGREVYAFVRPGDDEGKRFARGLGAAWAGGSEESPPVELDGAIIFASAGELVPRALAATKRGGTVVCAEIRMTDIPSFPYSLLWGERVLRSVANLTRRDGEEFLPLAVKAGVHAEVTEYPLEKANNALEDLRLGRIRGTAAIVVDSVATPRR